jgi:hypothetical protein
MAPTPTPKPKPYNPDTGSTLTPAQQKAKAAKEAAAIKQKKEKEAKDWTYYIVPSYTPGSDSAWRRRNKSTGKEESVSPGAARNALPPKVFQNKIDAYKGKQLKGKQNVEENNKLSTDKNRAKQSAYWNATLVKSDFSQAKQRYDLAYSNFQKDKSDANKTSLDKAKTAFDAQRKRYSDVFGVDAFEQTTTNPKSKAQVEAESKPASVEEKAKQDSLTKTKTFEESRVKSGLDGIYSRDDGKGNLYYYWDGNGEAESYVYLVGDPNGNYVPQTNPNEAYKTGSPVGTEDYLQRTIQRYQNREGGITELKQMLSNKGAYADDATAARSLSTGDMQDGQLFVALRTALNSVTSLNLKRLSQTKNKDVSLLDLNGWFNSAGKLPNSTAIGNGMNGTVVSHRSFKPEEYEIAIDQMFQATVGRGASEAELNDFLGKLRSYEQANPQTTTVTGSGTGAEMSTTSGGVNTGVTEALMRESALANPEAQKNLNENKYFNYLMEALAPTEVSQLG